MYRWTIRTFKKNLLWMWRDFRHGVANLVRWFPIIWADRDYDWGYLSRMMEYKFRAMGKNFVKYRICTDWELQARECFTCAELLRRLNEDADEDLWQPAGTRKIVLKSVPRKDGSTTSEIRWDAPIKKGKIFGQGNEQITSLHMKRMEEWQKMLGKLIGRKLRTWWD